MRPQLLQLPYLRVHMCQPFVCYGKVRHQIGRDQRVEAELLDEVVPLHAELIRPVDEAGRDDVGKWKQEVVVPPGAFLRLCKGRS